MKRRIASYAVLFARTRPGKLVLRTLLRRALGADFILGLTSRASAKTRRKILEFFPRLGLDRNAWDVTVNSARHSYEGTPNDAVRLEIYALSLLVSGAPSQAWALLKSQRAKVIAANPASRDHLVALMISIAFDLADYRDSVELAKLTVQHAPETLRPHYDYLKAAFAAGKLDDTTQALEFFGRQYGLIPDGILAAAQDDLDKVTAHFHKQALYTVSHQLLYESLSFGKTPKIGIFFLSSRQALGHAILDPFYFIALNKDRFDRLFFIGPPRSSYNAAPRACLQLIEQHGEYIETNSDVLTNLSWMSLGLSHVGPVEFVIDHYWALLRAAVHRTLDPNDAFVHNAWHLTPAPGSALLSESICKAAGINPDAPLIVIHVRDAGYHRIEKQSFRDSTIENYHAAITFLLDTGYQVVRIGDREMRPLQVAHPKYFELPFIEDYQHELDQYLIARAYFMIGCQSGPCAFARAFGIPLLTVNAVFHYTLLPSVMEMACFKRYFLNRSGGKTELSLEQALAKDVFHFENSHQFIEHGITLEEASSDEILASVKDMIGWLKDPALPLTDLQQRFFLCVQETAQRVKEYGTSLDLPIADYLGISLPGYRLSPSVAAMRAQEKLDAESHDGAEPRRQSSPVAPVISAP